MFTHVWMAEWSKAWGSSYEVSVEKARRIFSKTCEHSHGLCPRGFEPHSRHFFLTLTVGYLAWQNSITKENVNRAETEWRAEKKQQRATGCSTREWRTCAKGRYIFISSFNRGNMLCFRSLEVMTNAFQALDPSSNLGGCTFFVLSVLLLMLALKHVESRLWPSYFVPWKYVYNVAQFR